MEYRPIFLRDTRITSSQATSEVEIAHYLVLLDRANLDVEVAKWRDSYSLLEVGQLAVGVVTERRGTF